MKLKNILFIIIALITLSIPVYAEESIDDVTVKGKVLSSTISVIVPTKLEFTIDGEKNFIGGEYTFKNTGESPININLKSVNKDSNTTIDIVNLATQDWDNMTQEEANSKIGLKLGELDLSETDKTLVHLDPATEEKLSLVGYFGKNMSIKEETLLKYNMAIVLEKAN